MGMRTLELWQSFTRKDVHDIFSPDTPFTSQRGSWGLQGVVAIPDRPSSYVFLVTFGKRQGIHTFDESITEDGSWRGSHSLGNG
jgi:hypothetical protein